MGLLVLSGSVHVAFCRTQGTVFSWPYLQRLGDGRKSQASSLCLWRLRFCDVFTPSSSRNSPNFAVQITRVPWDIWFHKQARLIQYKIKFLKLWHGLSAILSLIFNNIMACHYLQQFIKGQQFREWTKHLLSKPSAPLLRNVFNMLIIRVPITHITQVSINLQINCFKFFQRNSTYERKNIQKPPDIDEFEVFSFSYSRPTRKGHWNVISCNFAEGCMQIAGPGTG